MPSKVLLVFLFFYLATDSIFSQSNEETYQGVPNLSYLMGDFPKEKALVLYSNPGDPRQFFLRQETKAAFLKLKEEYKKAHPEERQAPFIVSAYRSYSDQKSIWEDKYSGKKKMREPVTGKTPNQIVSLILEFSSAPGTSRHHWGTDIDINALENSYFEKGGKGEVFYNWMKENAHKFGFCQPYTPKQDRGNKGYNEEKWHWSYAPLSNRFQKDWVNTYKNGQLKLSGKFQGSEVLGNLPLEYVTSINPDCEKIK
ncbi:D-alanyl-D-alanine carboxypeptidase family protein [Leptospira semungkisensis]|uniref:D-alanyl-D-alanine carboxypeptidase family protein n=1 Tax=Leptospira semungkisensis TaxID=2484985 RepID=A0A4R9G5Y9_9LEPT|nr:M15 family metallopeptidase [Leptospira semungkisensis]TGK06904.1 D-alanyl-D-alanine carboxypeptidase family protein [Leptospira semungkisensis]